MKSLKEELEYLVRSVRRRIGPVPSPDLWCFVVGCYNSGTQLLHDSIATHRQVGSMPAEGQFRTSVLPRPNAMGLGRLWALEPDAFHLTEEDDGDVDGVRQLKKDWGASMKPRGSPVYLEKSPTNAARIRWLNHNFGNAHFIGIVRNGFAVAEGIRRKAGHRLELGARQWARSNEIMLRDLEAVPRSLLLTYEDFADDPNRELGRISEFLGLEPVIRVNAERSWEVHDAVSPIRNMNASSFEALSEEDVDVVEREAGEVLRRFGYRPL